MRKYACILVLAVLGTALLLAANRVEDGSARSRATGLITQLCYRNGGLCFEINHERFFTDDSDPALNVLLLAAHADGLRVRVKVQSSRASVRSDESNEPQKVTECYSVMWGPRFLPQLRLEIIRHCSHLLAAQEGGAV